MSTKYDAEIQALNDRVRSLYITEQNLVKQADEVHELINELNEQIYNLQDKSWEVQDDK